MLERVERALILYGLMLPMAIRQLLKDFAAEFDRQRKEIDELRSFIEGEKNASVEQRQSE